MKTLTLLSLSLAVALGMPPFAPDVAQDPVLTKEDQSPLLGDSLPVQSQVVVENPLPQVRIDSKEVWVPVDMEKSQSTVVKVKPEVGVEQKGEVKTEVKAEPEVKVEPEVKAEPEVKVEPEVKAEPEVKVEPEVKAEPEVKVEPEVKAESEVKVEQEVKVEPEVKAESEVKAEQEVKVEPEVEAEQEVKVEPEVKAEQEVKVEPEVEAEQEVKVEPEVKAEQEVKVEPEVKAEQEVKVEPEVEAEQEVKMEPEVKAELEVKVETEGKENPKVKVEPEVSQPLIDEEKMGQEQVVPDAAIIEEGLALDIMGQPMPPLEEYFPNEEARMGMEPGTLTEERSDYLMNEEPWNEFAGEEEPLPIVGTRSFEEQAMEDSPLLDEGVETGVVPENEQMALMRQGAENPEEEGLLPTEDKPATRTRYCPGVVYLRKCYRFFAGPKKPADAELFCQKFPGGHLASIINRFIHRQVVSLIRRNSGTRTWIGGKRFLQTGHFIWLDGSPWSYADWLPGEPNNTAHLEDCVELLGDGKFNDFTCWEPQSFVCSYTFR